MLDSDQLVTLKAHIVANTDPAVMAAFAIRNDIELARLYNLPSATIAWRKAATRQDIFEAMDLTLYDSVVPGKRDAWRMLMDNAPIDFGRNQMRKAVTDVWSQQTANQRDALLTGLTEFATVAEVALGGSVKTTGTVAATDRNWKGMLGHPDISDALNLP